MVKIIGFNGKTPEELKIEFHCSFCGCDFEAEYGDYTIHQTADNTFYKNYISYCPCCKHRIVKMERL